jgi:hypothetical protein
MPQKAPTQLRPGHRPANKGNALGSRRFNSQDHPVSPTQCSGARPCLTSGAESESPRLRTSRRPVPPSTSADGDGEKAVRRGTRPTGGLRARRPGEFSSVRMRKAVSALRQVRPSVPARAGVWFHMALTSGRVKYALQAVVLSVRAPMRAHTREGTENRSKQPASYDFPRKLHAQKRGVPTGSQEYEFGRNPSPALAFH